MEKKLFLISNSTNYGEEYLAWPREYITNFLKETTAKRILFVPYAGVSISYDAYTERVAKVFKELGYEIYSIHNEADPVQAVKDAEAIAVGGGNTFHLVYEMHKNKLIEPLRECVNNGTPYMGWSAGSNVACPSLKTTNDMPIIEPESFNCANLIPFQINPHYLDADPEGHGGETREQRLEEFLEANKDMYVVGLREATILYVKGNDMKLLGERPLRLFKHGEEAREISNTEDINFLL